MLTRERRKPSSNRKRFCNERCTSASESKRRLLMRKVIVIVAVCGCNHELLAWRVFLTIAMKTSASRRKNLSRSHVNALMLQRSTCPPREENMYTFATQTRPRENEGGAFDVTSLSPCRLQGRPANKKLTVAPTHRSYHEILSTTEDIVYTRKQFCHVR